MRDKTVKVIKPKVINEPRAKSDKPKHVPTPVLTRHDKAFATLIATKPEMSATEAYLQTHDTTNRNTAAVAASRTLKKKEVKVFLNKHERLAKNTIVDVLMNSKERKNQPAFQRLALEAANGILDRNLGKATVRTESESTNVNINVEGSAELNDQFQQFLKDQTQQA